MLFVKVEKCGKGYVFIFFIMVVGSMLGKIYIVVFEKGIKEEI